MQNEEQDIDLYSKNIQKISVTLAIPGQGQASQINLSINTQRI